MKLVSLDTFAPYGLSVRECDDICGALNRLCMAGHEGGRHYSHLLAERWADWVAPLLPPSLSADWCFDVTASALLFVKRDGGRREVREFRPVWAPGDVYESCLWLCHGVGAFWGSHADVVEACELCGFSKSTDWLLTGSAR